MLQTVSKIQNEDGKDIWLYGGSSLIKSFIQSDLIDIYQISLHPVAIGNGKPLFEDLKTPLNLSLIRTNVYKSGVVQLVYSSK
ncbi:dihydrofolate reductase family protein [Dyadobacter aurulentus]|uniref:dihydrofolate reductase family protein n=1 Tax=Dyadobacter sp. UC 10 TaxID=2605428 RepID=UPI0038D4362E